MSYICNCNDKTLIKIKTSTTMKFEVEFVESSKNWLVSNFNSQIGVNGVNAIRKKTDTNLHIDRINGLKSNLESVFTFSHTIEIPETLARASGLFKEEQSKKIKVRKGIFNNFLIERVKVDKDEETGEIKKAWIEVSVSDELVLDAWAEAGYPTEWHTLSAD